jgi:cell division protein FtsA
MSIKPERGITRPIAALDVGTSKVAAMVGVAGLDGTVKPLGVGARVCHGLKRGLVADMAATEAAIRGAMDMAERQAGHQASHCVVSLGAGGLMSHVKTVEMAIPGQQVTREQIAALLADGRRRIDLKPRTVLHAQPALYMLDGETQVHDPVGFHADRLGVDIHVVSAETPPIRNLDQCVRAAHLGIQTIVASPVAAGLAVLAEEERELGVALVDLGAGVTTVAVYGRGLLIEIAAIPMGGQDITDDIAAAFATKRSHAEKLKAMHGSASLAPRDNHEQLETVPIADDDAAESGRVTRAQLNQIVRARLMTIFARIAEALTEMGFAGPAGRQVVLTGGGAELGGIADFAQAALGRQVRIGRPRGLNALTGGPATAALSTLMGLAAFAAQDPDDLWSLAERHAARARADDNRSPFARLAGRLRANL